MCCDVWAIFLHRALREYTDDRMLFYRAVRNIIVKNTMAPVTAWCDVRVVAVCTGCLLSIAIRQFTLKIFVYGCIRRVFINFISVLFSPLQSRVSSSILYCFIRVIMYYMASETVYNVIDFDLSIKKNCVTLLIKCA